MSNPPDSPFGDPTAIHTQNRSAVGKGILFGCGGCAVVIVGIAAVFAAMVFVSFSGLAHNEAVNEAISRASASPRMQEVLGTPIARDWFTTGNIETSNGDSSADVRIPIKGPKTSAKIHVVGYKRHSEKWVFTVLEVTVTGTEERINLLQPLSSAADVIEVIIKNKSIWHGDRFKVFLIDCEITNGSDNLKHSLHNEDTIHIAIHSPAMTFQKDEYIGAHYAVVLRGSISEPFLGESEWTRLEPISPR